MRGSWQFLGCELVTRAIQSKTEARRPRCVQIVPELTECFGLGLLGGAADTDEDEEPGSEGASVDTTPDARGVHGRRALAGRAIAR